MSILYLFCIITLGQGAFLSIHIIQSNKTKEKAPYILAAITIIEVLTLYDEVFLFFDHTNFLISLFYIGTPLMTAIGPLVLAYIHFTAKPNDRVKLIHWLHFIPTLLIIFIALQNYHMLSEADKMAYINYFKTNMTSNEISKIPLELFINNAFRAYLLVYLIISWKYLNKSKKLIRSSIKENLIKILVLGFMAITLSSVLLELTSFTSQSPMRFAIFLFVFSTHIFNLTYIYFLPPSYLNQADKYRRSGLKDSELIQIKEQLEKALEEDKIYTDILLTSSKLANRIGTNTHYLSQLINTEYKKSYNELINEYRIKEAKILLLDFHNDLTSEEIAQKCGFGSPSTFFRTFKKLTGETPKQFRNNN